MSRCKELVALSGIGFETLRVQRGIGRERSRVLLRHAMFLVERNGVRTISPRGVRHMANPKAGRTVVAVIASYLAFAIIVGMTEQFLSFSARSHSSTPALSYYVLDLISQLFYTIVVGYLCHRIVPTQTIALGGLIGIGLVVGTVSLVTSWNREPHWYAIVLLVSYAPCVWIGWSLRSHLLARSQKLKQV